jgi:hypothetical protein
VPVVVAQAAGQLGSRDATVRAEARVRASDKQLAEQVAAKRALEKTQREQLDKLDRLKKQQASWNRDRNIRGAKADALATSQKLSKVTHEISRLKQRGVSQRRDLIAAIDAELAGTLATQRQVTLISLRSKIVSQIPRKPEVRKIVIPDDELDELADPEELEEQAALLAQAEKQLVREQVMLARSETQFLKIAKLRDQRQRATELEEFDNGDDVRRNTARVGDPSRQRGDADSSSENDAAGGAGAEAPSEPAPSTDDGPNLAESSVVLADVVDVFTVDALRRAERSTSARTKAQAARRAREQVEARLNKLRAQRKKIQQRARGLRNP